MKDEGTRITYWEKQRAGEILHLSFPLTAADVDIILSLKGIEWLYFQGVADNESVQILNEKFFSKRPEVGLDHKRLFTDEVDFLRYFTNLQKFHLGSLKPLSLDFLKDLKNLRHLELAGKFKNIEAISSIVNLTGIKLVISHPDLDFLRPLKHLVLLKINGPIHNFDALEDLPRLQELHVNYISKITPEILKPISKMPTLQCLRLDHLPLIEDFSWLAGSPLSTLLFTNLKGLKKLDGLEKLPHLQALAIAGTFKYLKKWNMEVLVKCKKLTRISVPPPIRKLLPENLPKQENFYYEWVYKIWKPNP